MGKMLKPGNGESTPSTAADDLFSKVKKYLLSILFGFIFIITSSGQAPSWVAGTPSIPSTGIFSITCNYGINMPGTVYIAVYENAQTNLFTGAEIKLRALSGPNPPRIRTFIIPIDAAHVNISLQTIIDVYTANSSHVVYLAAESSTGIIQAMGVRLQCFTLPCPKIDILTGFTQPVTCVNLGTTATFQTVIMDPATSGILKGTQWSLDWGDGTVATYTSTADNDLPPLAIRRHTYTSTSNCNYLFAASIRNPCGETYGVQNIAVVHGRDIPSDGDGMLQIVNNANDNPVIQVCEGSQSIITLRDNSIWNCQSPALPGGLTPVPNLDTRNIEWVYGADPNGTVYNTITGGVSVAGMGSAPQTSGRMVPSPYGSNSLSQAITIPATARAGQAVRVYLKNWNKCNPGDLEYVSTYVDIEVVAAPSAPAASNKRICVGDDGTLAISSVPVGTISWYRDAALTNLLGTGTSFVPPDVIAGTYTYYATDRFLTGIQCQSTGTPVTLTIDPLPAKPTISADKKNSICFDSCKFELYTMTALPAPSSAITSYQWYFNGILIPGETFQSITLCKPEHSGFYTVAAVGPAPSYCLGPQSDPWEVTVHTLSNLTNPVPAVICQGQTATFSAWTTDEVQNWQWEYSMDGGVNYTTVSQGGPFNGFNTPNLTITNPPVSWSGYLFRVEIKTPPGQGGCWFKSKAAPLIVDVVPTADAGPNISICTPTPFNPIYMTGTTTTGTYASAIWTGGDGLGTWTQNSNPSLAYFTPSVPSASFTATLTVTATTSCGGMVITDTRQIAWSQIPAVEAGPAISRCDATPLAPITMTGASASGTYSALAWSGGTGLGTWTQNADPALARFTPSVPNGSFTATLTATGSGACLGTNPVDTRTITWGQTPGADAGPDIGICTETPLAPIPMANASASGTYSGLSWSGGAGMGTWTQNANPALATFTPSVTNGSFVAMLTVNGTGACTGFNATDTRIIEWSWAATVNAGPDQGICAMANATLAGSIGGSATSATWSGGAGSFTPNNTTLNAVYSPTAAERAAQSVTLTLTTNDPAGLCLPVSDQVTISIGTMPTAAVLTSSGDACFNAAQSWINIAITGGGDPYRISYTLNGVARPDITTYYNNTHFNLGFLPVGTYTYAITQIRDNCGNILLGAGINPVTFQIYQNPVAQAGGDQAFCGFLTANLAAVPSIGIGTWSVVSGPGTGSFSPNANNSNAVFTASAYGSYVLRWTEVNGGICVSTSDKNVLFERTADAGSDQNLCGTLSATLAGNAPAVGQGTWTLVSGPGTVTFNPTANTPNATATVSTYGSYVFRWTVSNSGLCSTNDVVTVVYNPSGQVNKPADMFVCNGSVTSPVTFTTVNTGGITSYNWANNNTSIGLAASGAGNLPAFTATNPGTAPVSATITITPTFTNGTTVCPGPPVTFTITVNPNGQVDQPVNRIACENSTLGVVFTTVNTIGTTLYTWTNNNTGIGLPGSGMGDISFTTTNTTTAPITGTITVTPVFTWGGTSCPGPSRQFNITVNPEGQVNDPPDMVICNGTAQNVVFTTANTGGLTIFNWTNTNTAIGLGTDGAGNLLFNATNTGSTPITSTVTVTPSFNNGSIDCPGPSQTFTITVNPTPTLSSPLTIPDICSNTAVSYNPTSSTAGTTFSWTRGVVAGITPDSPTFGTNNPNETLRNITNIAIGVTYQYTLTANGCPNIQNVIVNVKPEPVVAPGQTSDVCSDNAVNHHINLVNFSNPSDNITFTWPAPVLSPDDPAFTGGTARTSASIQNISDVFTNRTGLTGTATYTVTPYKDGCAGVPEEIVIVVRPEPVLDPGLDLTVCSNTPIGLILREAAGSVSIDYYYISNVQLEDGLSADPGNAAISKNIAAPAGYLANDRYLNITGVNKTVTYTVQPFKAPDCYGDPVDVVITIRPQPYIVPAQVKSVCSGVAISKEILLSPANVPAGTLFSWPAPVMSDNSGQGTAGTNVAADPAGKIHINDVIINTSGAPITATYNITPISTEGCTGITIPVIITINPEPLPRTISGRDKICIGETNLVYNVTPVAGSTFHWTVDPAVGTKTFDYNTNAILINAASVPGTGIISVYETNSYTCDGDPSLLSVQVYTQPSPESISGPADVCAFSTHTYSINPRAGSTFRWTIPGGAAIVGDPSAASVTIVFGNVGGTISAVETNIAGCVTDHNLLTVTVRPLPSANISGGATICEGGTIPLNVVFSGTAPWSFTYAINGVPTIPISTSANPYVLNATLAGTYTIVNVTDATGCTNTGSGTALVSYYIRPTGTVTGGGEICRGGSSVVTFVFTGTAPFTFTYNNGTTNLTVPNYANTVYNLIVSPAATSTFTLVSLTDGNNCNGNISGSAVITVNNPPALTLTPTNLTCYNDNTGSIDLAVTGNSPFGYAWTGPGGFTAGTEDISGLRAGTYNVTVTDTKGCFSSGSVTLTEPGPVNATLTYTDITCFGTAEGEIDISLPVGGSGIYEYTIDGGNTWANTGLFTGLNPGTYDVRMRDANNPVCFRILNGALTLTGPEQLNAVVTPANIVCYGANNGSIVISSPSGGFGTYEYSVDGGGSWQLAGSFGNLAPGIYDVRIRDAAYPYCVRILNPAVEITEPVQLNATVESTNISCFGSTDGTITISAPSGGHGTYEFSVNGGGSWQLAGSFSNLAPGTYNVQIRDAAYPACYRVLNGALLITQPAVLRAVFTSTMITCFGADDGTITITGASGGTGTYEYSIDAGGSWQVAGTFTGLAPGSYDIRIRDAATPACEIILNSGVDITEPPALSGTVVKYDITCFGAADGRIMITNSLGGYGSYEYTINGVAWQTSNQFTGLPQGTYNVQMRDRTRTSCVLILDPVLVINEPAVLTGSASGLNVSCFNANDGRITISGESGGSGSYQYSINGGISWQGTSSFINLTPGPYDVRIRDAINTNCSFIINPNLIITEPDAITATVQSTNITCNGANDGTITISSPAGGYGTYEYTINGSAWQLSGSFTDLAPGFYNVQIRDAAHPGCVTVLNGSLRITEPAMLRATLQNTNVTCFGADDGTITITSPSGGYGTYEYSIDGGTDWLPTGSFTGLQPATYDVRIRDAAYQACVIILDPAVIITQRDALSASLQKTDATCYSANNGTIIITNATGGYGTYEYTIDGGGTWSTSGVFNGLQPGLYDVRIRDAANQGCEAILNGTLEITQPDVLSAIVDGTDITCYGASDGTISITNPSGGYGTYEYSVNGGGSWQSTGTFSNLVPGNYDVRIRDAANNTCVVILNSVLQITQPPMLNATVSAVMITCNGANDGRIDITSPTGGYGTYEYSVNGGGNWQLAGSFSDLAPGVYDVRIRDAVNTECVIILNGALSITQPAVLNAAVASTNVTCFGADNGSITLTNPTGGYGTYEYSINGGGGWQLTGTFINLAPGSYDVRIRERANILCEIVLNPSLIITEPAVLSASLTSTDITCYGASNGTITITGAAGGYGTYQYSVTGGTYWQPMGTFSNLMPGTYDVRIRDAANSACVIILDPAVIITQPDVLSATIESRAIACYGSTDGTITITNPSGGYGTYEYTVDGSTWSSSGSFTALAPGFYSVRIRDAANPACVVVLNGSLRITEPGPLYAVVQKTDISCYGANDGVINLTSPSGGYGTYEYSVDGGDSWQPAGSFSNLIPGTYDVRIRDAVNTDCVVILNPSLQITEPAVITANLQSTNVKCNGANNGTIIISVPSGGYGTYEYSVDGGDSWHVTATFINLAPGTYDVRIRDRAHPSCMVILDPAVTITEPDALSASLQENDITCHGAGDGTITISGATGGYGIYEYSINGGGSWQYSASFGNLVPGTYQAMIRDASDITCVYAISDPLTITEPDELNAVVNSTNITCLGAGDGTITISAASGGYGTYEYTINGGGSWQSSGTFTGLGPGNYNVQMRDAAHPSCITILAASLQVTQPAMLNAMVTFSMVTCFGANDGIITISSPTGGYGNYEYSVDGGVSWQPSGTFSDLVPGTYDVRMRDTANPDCVRILNGSLVITEPALLSANVASTNVTCFGASDGTINISFPGGGYGTYEYSIDGGTEWRTTGYFSGLAPGNYIVSIRDRAHPACVVILDPDLEITEPDEISATVVSTAVTCHGSTNGTITITNPQGGYGTYAYSINGGISWQTSETFGNLAPGTYDVRIRDAANAACSAIINPALEITEPDVLSAVAAGTNVTCYGASDGTITITSPDGGYGTYEYTINGGISWQTSGTYTDMTPGYYNVQIRDAANPLCTVILNSALRITEPPILAAVVNRTNVTCFGSNNGTITISGATGGYGTYEYSVDGGGNWQPGGTFSNLTPGTYDVRIRDAVQTDCYIILNPQLVITEPAILNATVTANDVTCFGATDGRIQITDPTGGSGSFLYSRDGGVSWQGSGMFSNLPVGTYDIRIRDAATPACIITLNPSLVISQPEIMSASVSGTFISCFGGNDGTITISSAAGGHGTYEFSVNGGGSWQSSGSFTGLTPGSYNILMRDAAYQGCIIVLDNAFVLTQPGLLSATVTKTDVSCNGNNDGTITISLPAGGYGTYEYSVDGGGSWQPEGTFSNLAPGTYVVRMHDAANPDCSVILHPNLVITEPLLLAMSTTGNITLDCYDDHDGMGNFYAYGGSMPYTFVVEFNTTGGIVAAPGFNSLTFYNAGAGSITVSVVDYNGCSAEATINVIQPDILTPGSIEDDQVLCFGDNPASLTEALAPSGGPGAYRYQWQYAADAAGPFMNIAMAASAEYTPPAAATYTLYYRRMVTSGFCEPVYSNVVEILVHPLPVAILSGGATICPGESSVLRVNLPAGTGPFTLDIENHGTVNNYVSESDIVVTPSVTTTYRLLRVRDANNCEVNAPSANLNGTATVIVSTLPSITSFTPSPAVCEYTLARFGVAAAGTNVTYLWYVNEGSGFSPVADGGTYFGATSPVLQIFNSVRTMNGFVYHVVVSGCSNSVTSPDAVFTVNSAAEIIQMPLDTTICMGQDAAFEADAQGTSVTWQWYVNKGAGFVPSVDDAYISGSNTRTLTITNAQGSFNNWYFRATATGTCGSPTSTNLAVLRVLTPPQVILQPIGRTLCEEGNTSFQANGRNYLSMNWQVNTGSGWTDLTEDATYLGTGSQMLNIVNVTNGMNGNQYRLALVGSCMTVYSDPATLVVNANPVVDFSGVNPVAACGGVPLMLDGNPSGGSGTYPQHNWTGDIGPLNNYYTQTPSFNAMMAGDYSLNYRVTDSNGCQASGDLTVRVDVPSAQFTQDISFGCTPLDVTFEKDMTGLTKWWWDFGDGSPVDSVNANPLHTFTNLSDGMIEYYDVTLRVQSAAGCYDEVLSGITVFPGVDASFAPDNDIICSGSPVTFTALPGAGRYFWDYGDGISGYSTNVSNHIYTNYTTLPVVRTVTLVTTSFYSCTDIRTYDITVMPMPLAQFTADPVTQVFDPAGTQVTFTNTTNEGTWDWLWRFGDSTTSVEKDPVHQYADVGTYYVTLIAGNGICSDSITRFITIVPPAPVAIFDPVESGCAPLQLTFNNTSLNTEVPGTTYRWDFGDGSTSTAKNPSYTYFDAGDYRIELTVSGPGGVSVMSRVVSSYPSPQAHFSLTPATVYANDVSVRFFNLTTGGSSFLWDFGDGDTSKVKDPSHKYMTEGVYDVTLWAYSENGCVNKYVISPAVTVLPVGDIRYPTVFTPNKNGPIDRTDLPTGGTDVDQYFYPAIRQEVVKYKLQIFNRWGVLIFESHDIHVPWNGYYKGELCPQGVYVWLVEGKYQDGKPFKKVGNVTLLQ